MKSRAELRIAARVRSDLPILSTACGVTRSGEDDVAISDMVLHNIDTVSVCQGLLIISTSLVKQGRKQSQKTKRKNKADIHVSQKNGCPDFFYVAEDSACRVGSEFALIRLSSSVLFITSFAAFL